MGTEKRIYDNSNVMFEMVSNSDKKATTADIATRELAKQLLLLIEKIHKEKLERGYVSVIELKK